MSDVKLLLHKKTPSGYWTPVEDNDFNGGVSTFSGLSGKPTTLAGYGILDAAPEVHSHTFSSLTSKPTTISGYGIVDAVKTTSSNTFTNTNQFNGLATFAGGISIPVGKQFVADSGVFSSIIKANGGLETEYLLLSGVIDNNAYTTYGALADFDYHETAKIGHRAALGLGDLSVLSNLSGVVKSSGGLTYINDNDISVAKVSGLSTQLSLKAVQSAINNFTSTNTFSGIVYFTGDQFFRGPMTFDTGVSFSYASGKAAQHRLSLNVPMLNGENIFSGLQTFNNSIVTEGSATFNDDTSLARLYFQDEGQIFYSSGMAFSYTAGSEAAHRNALGVNSAERTVNVSGDQNVTGIKSFYNSGIFYDGIKAEVGANIYGPVRVSGFGATLSVQDNAYFQSNIYCGGVVGTSITSSYFDCGSLYVGTEGAAFYSSGMFYSGLSSSARIASNGIFSAYGPAEIKSRLTFDRETLSNASGTTNLSLSSPYSLLTSSGSPSLYALSSGYDSMIKTIINLGPSSGKVNLSNFLGSDNAILLTGVGSTVNLYCRNGTWIPTSFVGGYAYGDGGG